MQRQRAECAKRRGKSGASKGMTDLSERRQHKRGKSLFERRFNSSAELVRERVKIDKTSQRRCRSCGKREKGWGCIRNAGNALDWPDRVNL